MSIFDLLDTRVPPIMALPAAVVTAGLTALAQLPAGAQTEPILTGAALVGVGGAGLWAVHTLREVEKKMDRVLAVLYGPPESKEADGVVKRVREQHDKTERMVSMMEAQSGMQDALHDRVLQLESARTRPAAVLRRTNVNGEPLE